MRLTLRVGTAIPVSQLRHDLNPDRMIYFRSVLEYNGRSRSRSCHMGWAGWI
jgi:hypothetical protein